eukprot:6183842-Pleurochrysis_carterae.AAC.2
MCSEDSTLSTENDGFWPLPFFSWLRSEAERSRHRNAPTCVAGVFNDVYGEIYSARFLRRLAGKFETPMRIPSLCITTCLCVID